MKKYILLLLVTCTLFGNPVKTDDSEKDLTKKLNAETVKDEKKVSEKTTEKTAEKVTEKNLKLEKNPYCYSPTGRHQFYEINDKGEYRADIKFKYCMFNNEKHENVIVGIITKDLNDMRSYIKKYAYLHFKEGTKIRQNSEKNNYYYDGKWAWGSSQVYPASIFEEKSTK